MNACSTASWARPGSVGETSPVTPRGMLIDGAGCGLLTWLIRSFGGYPEGVSFAILLMNMLTPLIDTYTRPRVFGEVKARA